MDDPAKFQASLSDDGRYRLLVESITDYAVYMLDPTGVVTSWNPGAQRFKGYRAAEILGQNFSRFYTDADRATGLPGRALATAARDGKFEGEGWRVRKDGARFWAHVVIDPIRDSAGRLVGYAKVTRDLTERRAAEESLKRSREQFRLLVQGVTDYAIYMLDTGGRVTSWNAGAERIKGYTESEILGTHFSAFYRPEDRRHGQPEAALRTAEREGRFESEGWRVRKDGSEFRAHVVVDPIRDDTGTLVGFAKITRDVTAQRQAQQALQQAQEALFQSQKMDAIGQLTGGVAHDFNNLLMVVLTSLEIIRRKMVSADPTLARLVDNAVNAAKRGAALTQRMLSFARRQDLKPVPVDVLGLVGGMLELMRRSLGPTIAIRILPADDALRRVRVDSNQLELALLNLVVNARDAMPQGGSIVVSAHPETWTDPQSRLAPGDYVRLVVRDSGEGMDPETLARATEPFFTTKGVGKGTGLGLSMVEGLASQSGGQFVLQSAPGAGSSAELWLPVADPSGAATAGDASAPSAGRSGESPPLRVLVVDDDGLVLANTVAMLEDLGHSVLGAGSADDAQTVLRAEPGVELLLTDFAMPNTTGAELIEAVRSARPRLAAILATGFAELGSALPDSVVRLAKPFGQAELARAIAESIDVSSRITA